MFFSFQSFSRNNSSANCYFYNYYWVLVARCRFLVQYAHNVTRTDTVWNALRAMVCVLCVLCVCLSVWVPIEMLGNKSRYNCSFLIYNFIAITDIENTCNRSAYSSFVFVWDAILFQINAQPIQGQPRIKLKTISQYFLRGNCMTSVLTKYLKIGWHPDISSG